MPSVSQSCSAYVCWVSVGAFNVTTIHWLSSAMLELKCLTGRSHACCRMTTAASILAFVGAAVPWLWRGRRTQENHGHSQS